MRSNCVHLCHTLLTCVPNNIVIIVAGKNVRFKYKSVYKSHFMSILVWLSKWLQMMHVYHFRFSFSFIFHLVDDASHWLPFQNVYLIVESFLIVCEWTCVNVLNATDKKLGWREHWTRLLHTRIKRQPIYNWIEIAAGTPRIVCR